MEPTESKQKTRKPLYLSVHSIDEVGIRLEIEEKPEKFQVLSDLTQSGEFEFVSPIRISASVAQEGDFIRVEGTVGATVRFSCGRCLTDFEAAVSDELSLLFAKNLPVRETTGAEEKEVRADEIGLIHYQGEHIDLRDPIQEQVVLMLPQKPLCSESCRGLCPQCGADLNQGDCGCKEPVLDDRLAVLKKLKIKGKKD